MLTKSGADDLAIRHLEQAYAVAGSEEARQQIANKLKQLRGQSASLRLEEDVRTFSRMLAERFPYAPEAFSIVVGPRTTAKGSLALRPLFDSPALAPMHP
jgi:hypothetical protein